jgi:flagellar FliL protein
MADPTEDPKPAGSKAARVVLPLVAALVGAGAGVGGMMFAGGGTKPEAPAAAEGEAPAEGEAAPAEGEAAPAAEGGGEGAAAAGEAKAEGAGAAGAKATAPGEAVITSVGSFTVNLRGSGGGRVLRIEVAVESTAGHAKTLEARAAQIRDSIITAVSDYTWPELEGADGKVRLRDELLVRVNGITEPARVQRLYFTQFVVQ